MDNDLYFLPMLLRVFERNPSEASLRDVLERITALGARVEYADGYRQFQRFMSEIRQFAELEERKTALMDCLVLALATGALDECDEEREAALRLMAANPELCSRLSAMRRVIARADVSPMDTEVILYRDKVELRRIPVQPDRTPHVVRNVGPGDYSLLTGNGWRIWESTLSRQDVEWAAAFPQRPFQMAADTDDAQRTPSRVWRALDETIELRLCPGIETGSLEVRFHA